MTDNYAYSQLENELRLSRQQRSLQQQRLAAQQQRHRVNAKKLYSSMEREFLALIEGDPRAFELPLLGEGQALYKQTTLQAPPNSHSACLSPLNYVSNVFITNVIEKLVFQDEQGNVISKTDGVLLGKIVSVKLVDLTPPSAKHQPRSGSDAAELLFLSQ